MALKRTAVSALMIVAFAADPPAATSVSDAQITIAGRGDVTARRAALIAYVWGDDGFPAAKLPTVYANEPSPVDGLENLASVATLQIDMEAGQTGYAHVFRPIRSNNRAVVLHHGHACSFNDESSLTDSGLGMQRTLRTLLFHGYSVAAVYMPRHVAFAGSAIAVNDCSLGSHDAMFQEIAVPTGSPLKFFLEPTAVALNYLKTSFSFEDYSMVGLSGGGWATAVYAALDPTIKVSVHVAGSLPLYLQSNSAQGDAEQTLPGFYGIAGYPDLYVMGAAGNGRRQVQILNRWDDCCFGELFYTPVEGEGFEEAIRQYEQRVRVALMGIGGGFFRVEIDDAPRSHMISWNAVIYLILGELNDSRPLIGASSPDMAFVRGVNGNLWQYAHGVWHDTGLATAGTAAVVQQAVHEVDLFYRGPGNRLMHAFQQGGTWKTHDLGLAVLADPAAASDGPEQLHVVSFNTGYQLVHGKWDGSTITLRVITEHDVARGLGSPAAAIAPDGTLHVFAHGRYDRALHHLERSTDSVWTGAVLPSTMLDFPAAVIGSDGSPRAYLRGASSSLWEAARTGWGWEWQAVSTSALPRPAQIRGTPAASVIDGVVRVHTRMSNGSLGTFEHRGGWTFTAAGGIITGAPVSTAGAAHARGQSGGLWLYVTGWLSRSGIFY